MDDAAAPETAMVDLSVIVPVFNAEATLAEQLDALAAASGSLRFEVVVADNGSTDGSLQVAERYRTCFAAMQIVDASDRRGAAYARNVGSLAARGSHLAFCDADDVVGDGWVEAIVRALSEHTIVASRFEGEALNDPEVLRWRNCPQRDGLMQFRYATFLPFAGACGLGVHKDVFRSLEGFDTTLLNGEDIDFCWRAQLAGWRLHFEPRAVMHIRMRGEPATLYRQTKGYGYWTVPLYQRYRHLGMPRVSWIVGAKRWLRLLSRTPHLLRPSSRRRWLKDAAYAVGLLEGSLRFGTLAL